MVRLYAHDVGAVDFIDRAAKATFAASSLGKAKRIAEHRRASIQVPAARSERRASRSNRQSPSPLAQCAKHRSY